MFSGHAWKMNRTTRRVKKRGDVEDERLKESRDDGAFMWVLEWLRMRNQQMDF